jgi:hypothetical protein
MQFSRLAFRRFAWVTVARRADNTAGFSFSGLMYAQKASADQRIPVDFQRFCAYISRMDAKRPMGRPLKGDTQRTARINLRAEPDDKARYEKAAAKADLSLTDWIKSRLDRAAKREIGD